MPREQRSQEILRLALPVFAKKGFAGTTTRELSEKIKVSEALLFKYFPSKDDLVRSIEDLVRQQMDQIFRVVLSWPVNAESLALAVAFNFLVLTEGHGVSSDKRALDRLVVFSLLEDGRFFRRTTKENLPPYFDFLTRCHRAGVKTGEIQIDEGSLVDRAWLCHHIAGFLVLAQGSKAIDYEGTPVDVRQEALRFCLRGLGFRPDLVTKLSSKENILERLLSLQP